MSRDPLEDLVRLLARLPGVGKKSGARLAYFILDAPPKYAADLAQAIVTVRDEIKPCPVCQNPSPQSPCRICDGRDRDRGLIMVVESPQDLDAVEKTGKFRGLYHVLGGVLSPLAGIGPDKLKVAELLGRARQEEVREIILATNPCAEGDATAAYLESALRQDGPHLTVSHLARGVPMGSELKYLDPRSLELAVTGRRSGNPDGR